MVELNMGLNSPKQNVPRGTDSASIRDKTSSQQEVSKFLLLLLHPCWLSLREWSLLESFLAAPMETVHSRTVPQIHLEAMLWLYKPAVKTSQTLCFEADHCWSQESV